MIWSCRRARGGGGAPAAFPTVLSFAFTTGASFRPSRTSASLLKPSGVWFRSCWNGATNLSRLADYYVRRNCPTGFENHRRLEADSSRNRHHRQLIPAIEHRLDGRRGNPFRPGKRIRHQHTGRGSTGGTECAEDVRGRGKAGRCEI